MSSSITEGDRSLEAIDAISRSPGSKEAPQRAGEAERQKEEPGAFPARRARFPWEKAARLRTLHKTAQQPAIANANKIGYHARR
jgi:hypothetical protein